jgi:GNAT superfamily N-acetyltransferase
MAFHRNWVSLFEVMPRYLPEARSWWEDGVFIGITGLGLATFNAAIIEDEQLITPDRLTALAETFRGSNLPYSVQIFSHDLHPPAEALLGELGYLRAFSDPLRARDGQLVAFAPNRTVKIRHVETDEDRHHFARVLTRAFDLVPSAQELIDLMLKMEEGFHVLAWMYGRAVGAGTLIASGGVAGVYNVATVPSARRQGVAAAVMAALHERALELGYPGTALASSSMGIPLYDRLGYHPDGFQFAWVPMFDGL